MIELFVKIVDRLIQLIEHQNKEKRSLFNDHIDPIYTDMRLIADDYFMILDLIEKSANNYDLPIENSFELLKERRKKLSRLRGEAVRYAQVLSKRDLLIEVQEFVDSVICFLDAEPTDSTVNGMRLFTPTTSLIEAYLSFSKVERDERKAWISSIKQCNEMLQKRWDRLSESYFNAKAKLL